MAHGPQPLVTLPQPLQRMQLMDLLRTEHAVARVLASAAGEEEAYPALLAAMAESLGWDFGAVWLPADDGTLRCAATWPETGEFAAESRSLAMAASNERPIDRPLLVITAARSLSALSR